MHMIVHSGRQSSSKRQTPTGSEPMVVKEERKKNYMLISHPVNLRIKKNKRDCHEVMDKFARRQQFKFI